MRNAFAKRATVVALALLPVALAGCASVSKVSGGRLTSRECMARAMYFESNRSSDDGMLAVGTVVMNRVESGRYPRTVCGVVGQPRQFAPGVLSKRMTDSGRPRAYRMADAVLSGARHPRVGRRSMFFHTAGYSFPYRNMHYVAIAGGNAFYEKRKPQPGVMLARQEDVAAGERRMASAPERRTVWEPERRVALLDRPTPREDVYESEAPVYEPRRPRAATVRDEIIAYDARSARGSGEPRMEFDAGPGGAPARPEVSAGFEAERYDRPVARAIEPREPLVIASTAPVRRRTQAEAPRSIEDLIAEGEGRSR